VLFLAVQVPSPAPPAPPDGKPVHVWLDAAGPITRGSSVRVYVRTAVSGSLVVLQRRTDGRIQVLFPAAPTEDPRVHAGSYEIRGPGDRAALVIAEPDGAGMILAAVSSDPIWFDEFARVAAWNPDALAPSWRGADPEGALSDIVQRMLGDGTFNYDIATYIVAPAVVAQAPEMTPAPGADSPAPYDVTPSPSAPAASIGTCIDCTVVGSEVVVIETPFFFGRGRRFHDRRPAVEPECHAGEQCDHHVQPAETSPLLAAQHAVVVPSRSELAARRRFSTADQTSSGGVTPTPFPPRRRGPPNAAGTDGGGTVALLPGRISAAVGRGPGSRALAGAAPEARSALAARYVHFRPSVPGGSAEPVPTTSTPPSPGPGNGVGGQRLAGGAIMTTRVVAVSGGESVAAPAVATAPVQQMGGMGRAWRSGGATAPAVAGPSAGASATATTAGGGTVSGSQTLALPLGAWRAGARPRVRH
jgi:uncharacterized protein DUF4384